MGRPGVSSAWAQSALQPLAEVVSHMMGVTGNCLSQAVWGCSRRRCGVRSGHHDTWRIPSTQKVDSGNLGQHVGAGARWFCCEAAWGTGGRPVGVSTGVSAQYGP